MAPARRGDNHVIETSIPSRLDSLHWGGFHTRVVVALGITWILDGLEVTLAGALSGALKQSPTLHFPISMSGFANSAYLAGAVLGALGFGWLTDRIGRKKLFFITLALYLAATAATALSWTSRATAVSISHRRRHRRRIHRDQFDDPGTGAGALSRLDRPRHQRQFLDRRGARRNRRDRAARSALIGPDLGWRLAYLTGAGLGLIMFVMRMWIPESPRWLMIHGHPDRAHAIVDDISARSSACAGPAPAAWPKIKLRMRDHTPLREVAHTLFSRYRRRTLVGLALMTAQAFFYNAIFFTFALVLTDFYGIAADRIGWYILPFAAGNFSGRCCSAGCSTRSAAAP